MSNNLLLRVVTLSGLLLVSALTGLCQQKWQTVRCRNYDNDRPERRLSLSYQIAAEKDQNGNPQLNLRLSNKSKKEQTFHLFLTTAMGGEVTGQAELEIKLKGGIPQYTSLFSEKIDSCSVAFIPEGTGRGFGRGGGAGTEKIKTIKLSTPSIKPPTIKPPTKD